MDKKYLAKIIASDNEGLQMISAYSAGAKVKVSDIKYLSENKVFLLSIERTKIETDQEDKKINSICRFDFVVSSGKTEITLLDKNGIPVYIEDTEKFLDDISSLYFEVVNEPRVLPQLKNQMAITLRDPDFTFTTEVRNIRIVQPD